MKKLLKKQTGEIITTLALLGLGVMIVGSIVGSWAIKQGPLKNLPQAAFTLPPEGGEEPLPTETPIPKSYKACTFGGLCRVARCPDQGECPSDQCDEYNPCPQPPPPAEVTDTPVPTPAEGGPPPAQVHTYRACVQAGFCRAVQCPDQDNCPDNECDDASQCPELGEPVATLTPTPTPSPIAPQAPACASPDFCIPTEYCSSEFVPGRSCQIAGDICCKAAPSPTLVPQSYRACVAGGLCRVARCPDQGECPENECSDTLPCPLVVAPEPTNTPTPTAIPEPPRCPFSTEAICNDNCGPGCLTCNDGSWQCSQTQPGRTVQLEWEGYCMTASVVDSAAGQCSASERNTSYSNDQIECFGAGTYVQIENKSDVNISLTAKRNSCNFCSAVGGSAFCNGGDEQRQSVVLHPYCSIVLNENGVTAESCSPVPLDTPTPTSTPIPTETPVPPFTPLTQCRCSYDSPGAYGVCNYDCQRLGYNTYGNICAVDNDCTVENPVPPLPTETPKPTVTPTLISTPTPTLIHIPVAMMASYDYTGEGIPSDITDSYRIQPYICTTGESSITCRTSQECTGSLHFRKGLPNHIDCSFARDGENNPVISENWYTIGCDVYLLNEGGGEIHYAECPQQIAQAHSPVHVTLNFTGPSPTPSASPTPMVKLTPTLTPRPTIPAGSGGGGELCTRGQGVLFRNVDDCNPSGEQTWQHPTRMNALEGPQPLPQCEGKYSPNSWYRVNFFRGREGLVSSANTQSCPLPAGRSDPRCFETPQGDCSVENLRSHGFNASERTLADAARVCWIESRADSGVVDGLGSWIGLFQINIDNSVDDPVCVRARGSGHRGRDYEECVRLYQDADRNIRRALQLSGGGNWTRWSTAEYCGVY